MPKKSEEVLMGGINPPPRGPQSNTKRGIEVVQVCEHLSSMNANIHLANVDFENVILGGLSGASPSMACAIATLERAMASTSAFDRAVAGLSSDNFQFGDVGMEQAVELCEQHAIHFNEAAVVTVNGFLAKGVRSLFDHFQARARAIRENLSLVMDDFIGLGERLHELTGAYQQTAVCENYTRAVTMANRLTEEWAYMAAVARMAARQKVQFVEMAVAISRRRCSRVLV